MRYVIRRAACRVLYALALGLRVRVALGMKSAASAPSLPRSGLRSQTRNPRPSARVSPITQSVGFAGGCKLRKSVGRALNQTFGSGRCLNSGRAAGLRKQQHQLVLNSHNISLSLTFTHTLALSRPRPPRPPRSPAPPAPASSTSTTNYHPLPASDSPPPRTTLPYEKRRRACLAVHSVGDREGAIRRGATADRQSAAAESTLVSA